MNRLSPAITSAPTRIAALDSICISRDQNRQSAPSARPPARREISHSPHCELPLHGRKLFSESDFLLQSRVIMHPQLILEPTLPSTVESHPEFPQLQFCPHG